MKQVEERRILSETGESMTYVERLQDIVRTLRSEHGCPWDRKQTHESIKPGCIEEAVEVIGGINILKETGKADNLREELGDLLLQVIFHAQLAEEEGLFSLEDVAKAAAEKMVRRHPHVFGEPVKDDAGEPRMGGGVSSRRIRGGRAPFEEGEGAQESAMKCPWWNYSPE